MAGQSAHWARLILPRPNWGRGPQRKRRLDARAAVPDEDGFITVTRQTKRSRNIDVGSGASCSSRKALRCLPTIR